LLFRHYIKHLLKLIPSSTRITERLVHVVEIGLQQDSFVNTKHNFIPPSE